MFGENGDIISLFLHEHPPQTEPVELHWYDTRSPEAAMAETVASILVNLRTETFNSKSNEITLNDEKLGIRVSTPQVVGMQKNKIIYAHPSEGRPLIDFAFQLTNNDWAAVNGVVSSIEHNLARIENYLLEGGISIGTSDVRMCTHNDILNLSLSGRYSANTQLLATIYDQLKDNPSSSVEAIAKAINDDLSG